MQRFFLIIFHCITAYLTSFASVIADDGEPLFKITFATDWKAQAEHGGFYQALASGLYRDAGLDVTLRPGGPQSDNPRLIAAGALDIAMASNNFQPINLLAAGADVKVVMASFQKDPQVLMIHPDDPAETFEDLQGRPIFISDSAIAAFWPWMKQRFGYSDNQIRKYTYSLAPWLVNKHSIQEGYLSSEPFTAAQAGVTPKILLFSDAGYPGYAGMVMVRTPYLQQNRDKVAAFVRATIQGWQDYLYGDNTAANGLILKHNKEMTPELLAYAKARMIDHDMIGKGGNIGHMTLARWHRFYHEMVALKAVPQGLDMRKIIDLSLLVDTPSS